MERQKTKEDLEKLIQDLTSKKIHFKMNIIIEQKFMQQS